MNQQTQVLVLAAKAGGEVLKKYFGQILETTQKSSLADFSTKADLESEKAILEILVKEFPDYNINSEEAGIVSHNSEFTLVIDPLDGTHNFVLGIPNFSVAIGLLKNNEIIAGVIYVPILNNVYYAEKGHGAFCNNLRLSVSKEAVLKNSSVAHTCGYLTSSTEKARVVNNLILANLKRVLMSWSVAFDFCMLASGRIESIYNDDSQIYDFAAGKLIAMEAGAVITDLQGQEEENMLNKFFVCSCNSSIQKQVLDVVAK